MSDEYTVEEIHALAAAGELFTCAGCEGLFRSEVPQEQADAECEAICDDCYNRVVSYVAHTNSHQGEA